LVATLRHSTSAKTIADALETERLISLLRTEASEENDAAFLETNPMPVVSRSLHGTHSETSHHLNVSIIARELQNLLTSLPGRVFMRNSAAQAAQTFKSKMHQRRQAQNEAQLKENIVRFQLSLANDPDTADNTLKLLSKSEHRSVLVRVADHPKCPEEIMQQLSLHPDAEVRTSVASNVNLPESIMTLLLTDSDPTVRHCLAEAYNAPSHILSALCDDENPYVACRAAETLARLRDC
jgi:hypothetical protein